MAGNDIDSIHAFWSWFRRSARGVERDIEAGRSREVVALLGPRVRTISDKIGWEVGPGVSAEFSLSFTLNGDLANLGLVETVLSASPRVSRWEFHAGRPPKPGWNFTFVMRNAIGAEVSVDASGWTYYLVGFNQLAFFDITLVAPDLPRMDEAARQQAGSILIEGLIGERLVLERFDRIEVVTALRGEQRANLTSVRHLANHIKSLLNNTS